LIGIRQRSWDRIAVAEKFLAGAGIEIGALHSPLQLPPDAKARYVDRMTVPDLRRQYPELSALKLVDIDIIDDGETLDSIEDATQDFVIANHFIEHCQNPLLALKNMLRVLKPGGILYLAIPDKRFTFDVDRPVTSFEHIFRDYEEGPAGSRTQHFEEWAMLVDKVGEGEVMNHAGKLMAIDYSIHFHVWSQAEMFEWIAASQKIPGFTFDVELFLKNPGECIWVLRK
jgi:predicted SAM-dependent methyltransferase